LLQLCLSDYEIHHLRTFIGFLNGDEVKTRYIIPGKCGQVHREILDARNL